MPAHRKVTVPNEEPFLPKQRSYCTDRFAVRQRSSHIAWNVVEKGDTPT